MHSIRSYSADTEDTLWPAVAADLGRAENQFDFVADLTLAGLTTRLSLDVDLGGGFEGGSETTTLSARVPHDTSLRFALHEQDWVHELGKLLGLTDVKVGDPALDAAYIITTNDPAALRGLLLQDPAVRQALLRYRELRLSLAPTSRDGADVYLTLVKEAALDAAPLRELYHAFYSVLHRLSA
jgi:hypothetical protein